MKNSNRLTNIRDYIIKYSKFVFPVIVIAVVAITVSVALNANNARAEQPEEDGPAQVNIVEIDVEPQTDPDPAVLNENAPLTVNEDEQVQAIVLAYYNAMVAGDTAAMEEIYDEVSLNDQLSFEETAKYLDHIPSWEIYTKPGMDEGSRIVYVYYRLCFVNHEEEVPGWQTFYLCTREDGSLYFKNGKNLTDAENEYITNMSVQDDVVECNNRVSVEYNELMEAHPELLSYIGEFREQVKTDIGEALAKLNTENTDSSQEGEAEGGETGTDTGNEGEGSTPEDSQPPVQSGPQYATATTTVNVRKSDSELADKLGKVTGGTRLEVQEVRLNGWTKVVYEGEDGYIKSEFLNMEESVSGLEVIGTVTATTNINVRSAASQDSESLGILNGGSSLDLYGNEGEWCKVNYNGRVGYVKAEFVTQ